jgi:outer membrane protein assembly factor BamB
MNRALYAINPDGTKKWAFWTGGGVFSSPALGADGIIYVGSMDGTLYAINPDRTLKWAFRTGGGVGSSPAIGVDGTIYVGSHDGKLYAIDPDRTLKWAFQTEDWVVSSPALGADGTIYVGSMDGTLYAINPDGTKKWAFQTGDWVKASPAIGADGTIYVGSRDWTLYAINPDGTQKWAFQTENWIFSCPAIGADGTIYATSSYKLYAIYSDSYGPADSSWPMFRHDVRHTGRFGYRERPLTSLTPGEPYAGTIWPGQFHDFSLAAEAGTSLLIEIVPQEGSNSLFLDGTLGEIPPYVGTGDYTTRATTPRGRYELLISPTEGGTYYFSLFGYDIESTGGHYTITARYVDQYLSDIAPSSAGNTGAVTITLQGLGFLEGMEVELAGPDLPVLTPAEINVASPTQLLARFDLSDATLGDYDVTVIWPDHTQDSLPGAFEITSGIGPRLEAHLDPPELVRPGRSYTLWLQYQNTGDADLPAPLLTISGNTSLALESDGMSGDRVQILGIGHSALPENPGVGESRRIPVYFIAPGVGQATFTLSVTQDSPEAIDWAAQKELMKPPAMTEAEWDALWPSLIARLGGTWAEYLAVLRADALRMKGRGREVYDVRKLIRLEARQAAGKPVAAISGTLRDSETGMPLKGVPIKVRSQDGSVLRQTLTSYAPKGHFVLEDLPDATYQVLVEGYYFADPVTITVAGGEDVNGVVLYASNIPPGGIPGEEIGIPDHRPALARDQAGSSYLAWQHGNEIWWAVNRGDGWNRYGPIPNAEGTRPVLVYSPTLLDHGTSPGLFCAWESSASPQVILWSAGRPTEDGIIWSDPQALTADGYDDYGIALVVDNGNPLILWLQRNLTREDDTDLYYQGLDLSGLFLNWLEPAGGAEAPHGSPRSTEFCGEVELAAGESLPKGIPFIGGKYGFEILGGVCGADDCQGASLSGKVGVNVHFGKHLPDHGEVGAEAKWVMDAKRCQYIFQEGKAELSIGASTEFLSPPIPIVIYGVPIGEARVGGHIAGSAAGTLYWQSNFPSWPDQAGVSFEIEAGPKGVISLFEGGVEGEVTGAGSLEAEYKAPPPAFTFGRWCLSLEGAVRAGWGFLKLSWTKKWGPCVQAEGLLMPLAVYSYRDSWLKMGSLLVDDVPVYEELEYIKEPLSGTGAVYEGNPVLGDISGDVYNDGLPAVARSDSGEIMVVWSKDFPAADLGAKVYAATYDGTSWGEPVAITPEVDFNKDTAVVYDTDGNPMAVWSSAANDGLDYVQSSVEEILAAQDAADIMYARRLGGVWTAPEVLASLPGRDEQVHLYAGPDGEITAAWINQSDSGSTLYASIWNGSGWSEPVALATAVIIESHAVSSLAASPMVIWAQDSDGDINTFDDWRLYASSWDGFSWSAPVAIDVERAEPSFSKARSRIHPQSIITLVPPEGCCQEKDQEDPIPPDPPKPPKEDIGEGSAQVIAPIDPNEKVAPQGEGEEHAIDAGDRLRYLIYFENQPEATAPAQEVFITDCLDYGLDWTTLKMEDIAFGDHALANSQDTPIFHARVTIPDYREGEEKQWWVDIDAGFNGTSGCLETTFRTLDPETGQLPEDPLAGFLPPEDGSGRGQGYIAFSVETKKGLEPGTTVKNDASIVFDTSEPLVTNEVFNTIAEGDISVDPPSHHFGSVVAGSMSAPQSFTVTNTGNADLAIGTISLAGTDAAEFSLQNDNCSGQAIALLTRCTVEAVFAPSPQSEGEKHAHLSIPSDDPDTPALEVPLTGVATLMLIEPDGGTIGTLITITGRDFGTMKGRVFIGGKKLKVLAWTDTSIQGQVRRKLRPGTYDVMVKPREPRGAPPIISEAAFTIWVPAIDSIEPASGSAGDAITIRGLFFGTSKGIVFLEYMKDGQPKRKICKVRSWTMNPVTGESEVVFLVPKRLSPGMYDLTVINKIGSATVEDGFTIH